MTLKLDMQLQVLAYYQLCSNDDHELTLTFLTARLNLLPYAFVWEHTLTVDFLATIEVYGLKVSTQSQLNKNMKINEYPRSRSFIDFCPRSLRFHQFQTFFFSNHMGAIEAIFHVEPPLAVHGKGVGR